MTQKIASIYRLQLPLLGLWVKQVEQRQQGSITEIAANGVLALLSVACTLLDRQLAAQAEAFQQEGGFTERLYRTRTTTNKRQ